MESEIGGDWYMYSDDDDLSDAFERVYFNAEEDYERVDVDDISVRAAVLDIGKRSRIPNPGGTANQLMHMIKYAKPIAKPVSKSLRKLLKPIIRSTNQLAVQCDIDDEYVFPSLPESMESADLGHLNSKLAHLKSVLSDLLEEKKLVEDLKVLLIEENMKCRQLVNSYRSRGLSGIVCATGDVSRIHHTELSSQVTEVARRIEYLNKRINNESELTVVSSEGNPEDIEHIKVDPGAWGAAVKKISTLESMHPSEKKEILEQILSSSEAVKKAEDGNERLFAEVIEFWKQIEEEGKKVDNSLALELKGSPGKKSLNALQATELLNIRSTNRLRFSQIEEEGKKVDNSVGLELKGSPGKKSLDALQGTELLNIRNTNRLRFSYMRLKIEEMQLLVKLMKKDSGFYF